MMNERQEKIFLIDDIFKMLDRKEEEEEEKTQQEISSVHRCLKR